MNTVWKLVMIAVLTATFLADSEAAAAADGAAAADSRAPAGEADVAKQAKTLSGMSVLGNNEAPKALVIVPWKSSQIGDGIGIVESLSNRPMPIDRDVFSRELDYYYIRSNTPNPEGFTSDGLDFGAR